MKKSEIIFAISGFLSTINANYRNALEKVLKQLQSPDIDIIIWNDMNVSIPDQSHILFFDGKSTKTYFLQKWVWEAEIDNMSQQDMLDAICKYLNSSPFIKWTLMPQYKP